MFHILIHPISITLIMFHILFLWQYHSNNVPASEPACQYHFTNVPSSLPPCQYHSTGVPYSDPSCQHHSTSVPYSVCRCQYHSNMFHSVTSLLLHIPFSPVNITSLVINIYISPIYNRSYILFLRTSLNEMLKNYFGLKWPKLYTENLCHNYSKLNVKS